MKDLIRLVALIGTAVALLATSQRGPPDVAHLFDVETRPFAIYRVTAFDVVSDGGVELSGGFSYFEPLVESDAGALEPSAERQPPEVFFARAATLPSRATVDALRQPDAGATTDVVDAQVLKGSWESIAPFTLSQAPTFFVFARRSDVPATFTGRFTRKIDGRLCDDCASVLFEDVTNELP